MASFSLHLAAVGVWTYAIAASLFAARDLRRSLGTFTPYAVVAAVVVALTGLVNAILELADPADLVETGYGLVLLAKSAAFVAMAAFGLIHFVWRRRPAILERRLRLPLRSEAVAATLALVLATLLVSFPNPPREAEATASELTGADPVLADLATRDALSIADASGPFVVGLTILPPKPGQAEARVAVLGMEPGDGLRNARLTATSGSARLESALTEPCGLGCFAGQITFDRAGEWQLKVQIESNRGPIEMSAIVPLPSPDGSAALARTLAAEEALQTAEMTERLSGSVGGPTFVTTYRFQMPDKAELTLKEDTTILAGEQQFRRTGDGPWQTSTFPPPGFSWPSGYYREFWGAMAAPRIIGTADVDGVPAQVIAFVRPDVPAWFRLWVRESDGVVLRQEMRAEGHIMDQTYSDLNGSLTITPPG
ncbi:MAG: CopD family protein [Solirubrobacterales bacterium]